MRRQSGHSPAYQCCCCYKKSQIDPPPTNKNTNYDSEYCTPEDVCCKCRCSRLNSGQTNYHRGEEHIDKQTKHALSSLRQKACRFINSESECSTTSESTFRPCTCKHSSPCVEDSILQKAQDIDYVPDSEFLKKLKRDCQNANNYGQRLSFGSDLNEGNDFIPKVCEECITKSNQIIKLLEQLNNARFSTSNRLSDDCEPCHCSTSYQPIDPKRLQEITQSCRNAINEIKNDLANVTYMQQIGTQYCCGPEEDFEEPTSVTGDKIKKAKTKSQHLSRSKKRVRCRGRRKKKSKDSETCYSQDNFEPTLKKPHENSCERCWRYASPSRSPVNKPEQRFDPNFRRAHSCQDFISNTPIEDEADPAMIDKGSSTPKTIRPAVTSRLKDLSGSNVKTPSPQRICSTTKMKELMLDESPLRTPQSTYHRGRSTLEEINRSNATEYSDSDRKRRPKSCSPGVSSLNTGHTYSFLDQTNATEYKDIKIDKRSPRTNSSHKYSNNDVNINQGRFHEKFTSSPKCQDVANSQVDFQANPYGKPENFHSGSRSPKEFVHLSSSRQDESNFDSQSTMYRDVITSRNSRPPSPIGRPNACICSNCGNKSCSGRADSPKRTQPEMSRISQDNLSPVQAQSSVYVQNGYRSSGERRPRTTDRPSSAARDGNRSSERISPTQYRCCCCRKRSQKQRPAAQGEESIVEKRSLCCRCCRKGKSQEQISGSPKNSPRNPAANERSSGFPEVNERRLSAREESFLNQENKTPARQEASFGKDSTPNHAGKKVPCPHRQYAPERTVPPSAKPLENQGVPSREFEGRRYYPRVHHTNYVTHLPTKYCVFYMTKNKDAEGNEVEVLVEELTERSKNTKKNWKTSALKDKMIRLQQCPAESMALKFQKGMTGTQRKPETTRILYF